MIPFTGGGWFHESGSNRLKCSGRMQERGEELKWVQNYKVTYRENELELF